MHNKYTFRYNAFFSFIYFLAAAVGCFLYYESNIKLYAVGYFLAIILLGWLRSRGRSLTLDENGITIHRYFSGDIHIKWDEVSGIKEHVAKKNRKRNETVIGIIRKGRETDNLSDKFNEEDYVWFIDTTRIAASEKEVVEALKNSVSEYVQKKRSNHAFGDWANTGGGFSVRSLCGVLLVAWLGMLGYASFTFDSLMPKEHATAMCNTLINGTTYINLSLFSFWPLTLVQMIVFVLFPILWGVKQHVWVSLLFVLGIGSGIWSFHSIIPERHVVFDNCSLPTKHSVKVGKTLVLENLREDRRRNFWGFNKEYMRFMLQYDGQVYDIKKDYNPSVSKGDTITYFIQKGSLGIPILREYRIKTADSFQQQ